MSMGQPILIGLMGEGGLTGADLDMLQNLRRRVFFLLNFTF